MWIFEAAFGITSLFNCRHITERRFDYMNTFYVGVRNVKLAFSNTSTGKRGCDSGSSQVV